VQDSMETFSKINDMKPSSKNATVRRPWEN